MFVCVRFLYRNLSRYCDMKFAEYMETFGAVHNSFQGLSNTTMHIKKSKNGVKRERRLLKERTFKIEAKRYPLDSENIEVLKSLRDR